MTEDDARAFFREVEGKKIRCTDWAAGVYFIPKTLWDDRLVGQHKIPGDPQYERVWNVHNGFDPHLGLSFYWEFFEGGVELTGQDRTAAQKACDCPLEKLMNLGCNCGGI